MNVEGDGPVCGSETSVAQLDAVAVDDVIACGEHQRREQRVRRKVVVGNEPGAGIEDEVVAGCRHCPAPIRWIRPIAGRAATGPTERCGTGYLLGVAEL